MTAATPGREQEIRARAEAATREAPEHERMRWQLAAALLDKGAYCGECNFEEDSKTCPYCIEVRARWVEAILPVVDAAVAAAVRHALVVVGSLADSWMAPGRSEHSVAAGRYLKATLDIVAAPASGSCRSFTNSEVAPGLCELCHEPESQHTQAREQGEEAAR